MVVISGIVMVNDFYLKILKLNIKSAIIMITHVLKVVFILTVSTKPRH